MKNHLLYRAIDINSINECRYALLKYLLQYNLKPPQHTAIVIYTDKPHLLEVFAPFFHKFVMHNINQLPLHLHHATAVIRHFFSRYTGNLLYCNTNTYPVQPLEPLFQKISSGQFFLYRWATAVKGTKPAWHSITNRTSHLKAVENITATAIWQTSIIGTDEKGWQAALTPTGTAALQQGKIINTPEDVLNLAAWGAIQPANDFFADYRELKEFSYLLQKFFLKYEEESIPNLLKLVQHIDVAAIQQQKAAYQQLPFYKKWLKTITGQEWSIRRYENKL